MSPAKIMIAASLLALSGGAAFAQGGLDEPRTGFYADPVLPDPSPIPGHVYPAAQATSDVAAVMPAKAQREPVCSARNPCAAVTPPARG